MPLFTSNVKSIAETGQTKLKGDVTISEGSNVTITQVGQDLSIAANVDEADVVSIGEVGNPLQGVVTLSGAGITNLNTSGQNIEVEVEAVSSLSATESPDLTGDVTLSGGTNISLVQVGQNIEINSTPTTAGVTSFAEAGGTQLTGDVTISQGSNVTITEVGNNLDIAASTDSAVTSALSNLDNKINNTEATVQTASSSASNATIDTGNTSHTSNEAEINVVNGSDYRTMGVMYTAVARIYGNADNALTDRLEVAMDLQINIDGGGWNSTTNMDETFNTESDNPRPMDRLRMWSGITTKAAGGTSNIKARCVLDWNGAGASAYIIDNVLVQLTAVGVSQ